MSAMLGLAWTIEVADVSAAAASKPQYGFYIDGIECQTRPVVRVSDAAAQPRNRFATRRASTTMEHS